jgi:hypothetical protein
MVSLFDHPMTQAAGVSYRKSANHVTRTIADETIVVPIRANAADLDSIFVLNESGAAIWAALEAEADLAAIATALVRKFDVEPGAARADAERFLAALRESGLVEETNTP